MIQSCLGDSAGFVIQIGSNVRIYSTRLDELTLMVDTTLQRSHCTNSIVRSYFVYGTLSAPGTICLADFPPLPETGHVTGHINYSHRA